jgi:hypothetical protein
MDNYTMRDEGLLTGVKGPQNPNYKQPYKSETSYTEALASMLEVAGSLCALVERVNDRAYGPTPDTAPSTSSAGSGVIPNSISHFEYVRTRMAEAHNSLSRFSRDVLGSEG